MSVTGMNAGDVILINNGTLLNIFGQKKLRKHASVNFTHVALSLGDGIFIHADTSCGVDFVFFPDLLGDSDGRWKVIRYKEVSADFEKRVEIAGVYHLQKVYNYGFILKENEKSLFCSQFVDLVYKSVGIDIFGHNKGKGLLQLKNAFPSDFEALLTDSDSDRWSDVTNIYHDELNGDLITELRTFFITRRNLAVIERNSRKFHANMLGLVHALNDSHNLLPEEYKTIALENHLTEIISELNDIEDNFFYDFWNVKSNKRI
jgi:hypothetical protein